MLEKKQFISKLILNYMKRHLVTLGACLCITLLLCSCSNKLPTREVLTRVTVNNSKAERIDTSLLKGWSQTIQEFKSKSYGNHPSIDLRTATDIEFAQKPEYAESTSDLTLRVVNDSIIRVSNFDPLLDKSKFYIYPHDEIYIFHSNGDVEAKLGNMVNPLGDHNDGTFIKAYLDGQTGLIVNYELDDPPSNTEYRITDKGEISKGSDYGKNFRSDKAATDIFMGIEKYCQRLKEKM